MGQPHTLQKLRHATPGMNHTPPIQHIRWLLYGCWYRRGECCTPASRQASRPRQGGPAGFQPTIQDIHCECPYKLYEESHWITCGFSTSTRPIMFRLFSSMTMIFTLLVKLCTENWKLFSVVHVGKQWLLIREVRSSSSPT
jgi:hypothetical protein